MLLSEVGGSLGPDSTTRSLRRVDNGRRTFLNSASDRSNGKAQFVRCEMKRKLLVSAGLLASLVTVCGAAAAQSSDAQLPLPTRNGALNPEPGRPCSQTRYEWGLDRAQRPQQSCLWRCSTDDCPGRGAFSAQ